MRGSSRNQNRGISRFWSLTVLALILIAIIGLPLQLAAQDESAIDDESQSQSGGGEAAEDSTESGDAGQPTGGVIPLGDLLAPDGTLVVPEGSSGSIDPTGWTLVSGENEPPRFMPIPKSPTALNVPGDENWSGLLGFAGVYNSASPAINALAWDANGDLYLGGNFSSAGDTQAASIAKWTSASQSWSTLTTGTAGSVSALLVVGSDLYVGGGFTSAGGVANTNRIARWDGLAWSAVCGGIPSGTILALAVDGSGDLYAGGTFANAGGDPNADGVAKCSSGVWSALGTGISVGSARALAYLSPYLYVAGSFANAGGLTGVNNIAAWHIGSSTWSAVGTPAGTNGQVNALITSGSDLYVGGAFATAGGIATNGIAKWNGAWAALSGGGVSGGSATVSSFAIHSGNLYLGGNFTTAGGAAAQNVASFALSGSWNAALGSGISGATVSVNAIAAATSTLAFGGTFSGAGSLPVDHLANWTPASSSWSRTAPNSGGGEGGGASTTVFALAYDGSGNLYAGGLFTGIGNVLANRIARWDGTSWSAMGSGFANNQVNAIAVDSSGTVYAAGNFTSPQARIARWNSGGSTWDALGAGLGNTVETLATDASGNLYAGGLFLDAGGDTNADRLARWNGSAWSNVGGIANSTVNVLMVDTDYLYAGGGFATIGGVTLNRVGKYGPLSGSPSWSAFGTGATSGNVLAIVVSGSTVFAGGTFTSIGTCTTNCNRVAKWDGSTWSALATGSASQVNGLALDSTGRLYASGLFNTTPAGGRIAVWNGTSWSALGVGHGDGQSEAILFHGSGRLWDSGTFSLAGGKPSSRISLWTAAVGLSTPTTGTYTFYVNNMAVVIEITTHGGNLDRIHVQRFNKSALSDSSFQTGYYWEIDALQSDGVTAATGVTFSLTLPFTGAASGDEICRFAGGTMSDPANWTDCGGTIGTNTITRTGLTNFGSAWTIKHSIVNNPPVVNVNTGLTVNEGALGTTITSSMLSSSEGGSTPAQLVYTVTTAVNPARGILKKSGTPVLLNGTFTQADINSSAMTYDSLCGNADDDSFVFKVTDDDLQELTGQTFSITRNLVDPDGDAISTCRDNCPAISNAGQEDTSDHYVGAVAHWNLNQGSGTTATDVVNPAQNGTLVGDATWTASSYAGAAALSSPGDSYDDNVEVANDSALETSTATISAWVRPNWTAGSGSESDPVIVSMQTNNLVRFQLRMDTDLDRIAFCNGPNVLSDCSGATGFGTLTQDTWHHVAAVVSGASTIIYLDGVARGTLGRVFSSETGHKLRIGSSGHTSDGIGAEAFNGSIDEVYYYNIALTATQIENYFQTGYFGDDVGDACDCDPDGFPPTVTTNTGMTVLEGPTAPNVISTSMLNGTDLPAACAGSVYFTVTTAPIRGTIRVSGSPIGLGGTFTPANIAANAVTYEHDGSETISDSFGFSFSDSSTSSTGHTFAITVTPVNDAPVAVDDTGGSYTTNEDTTLVSSGGVPSVLSNDVDPDSTLTVSAYDATSAKGGTVVVNSNGTISYSPPSSMQTLDTGGSDTDTFNYTANDGYAPPATDVGQVTITITGVNDVPTVSTNTGLTVAEGSTGNIINATKLAAADVDDTQAELVFTLTTAPTQGTLRKIGVALGVNDTFTPANLGANQITYDHNGNEPAAESFGFSVGDGEGALAGQSFSITVTPVNDPPDAVNDSGPTLATSENASLSSGGAVPSVLANDTDPDGPSISVTAFDATSAYGATVSVAANGNFTYNPTAASALQALDAGDSVGDTFGYTASDTALTDTATVTITVSGANDAPTIPTNTGTTVNEASSGNVIGSSKLAAADVDGDDGPGALVFTLTTAPTRGTLRIGGVALAVNDTFTQLQVNGNQLTYDHDGSETTSDSFGFSLTDGTVTLSGQTFAITVTPVNDPPTIPVNTGKTVLEGSSGNVVSSAELGATDPDNGPGALVFTLTTAPSNGTLRLSGSALVVSNTFTQANINSGLVTYDHNGSETLSDSIGFSLSDGNTTLTGQTFAITVTPVDDPPTIPVNTGKTVFEASTGNVIASAQLAAADPDNAPASLVFTLTTVPVNGTLRLSGGALVASNTFTQADINGGLLTYDHDGSETTSDGFGFSLSDGNTTLSGQTFAITVTPVNDAPIAVDDSGTSFATTENATLANAAPARNCSDHLARGRNTDGVYWIDPDGLGGSARFQAYCDMTTDGGGWTLVLNYRHQGGTNPAVQIRSTNLPLLGSSALGGSESGTAYWGHASNALLNAVGGNELRFYGITSDHARVIHFKSSLAGCVSYLKSGSGSCSGLGGAFTSLSGHTANLPAAMDSAYTDRGDRAMSEFTFYSSGSYHWGVYGNDARWEVDDFPNSDAFDTIHRVFIRGTSVAGADPLLMNDTDAENDTLSVSGFDATSAQGAAVVVGSNGSFSYNPTAAAALQALDAGDNLNDTFNYTAYDGAASDSGLVTISVAGANDAPTIPTNTGATFLEGSLGNVITSAMLAAADVDGDDGPTQLVFTVTSVPVNGTLRRSGTALGVSSTFTQANINSGVLTYDHNGSDTLSDSFGFSLTDGTATVSAQTFAFIITPVSDPPSVTTNTGMTVAQGSSGTVITQSMLETTDPDNSVSELVYTVSSTPAGGIVFLLGVPLGIGNTFTQLDINDGFLTFDSTGCAAGSPNLGFSVTDGQTVISGQTFAITITGSDTTPPIARCEDRFLTLDAAGNAAVEAFDPLPDDPPPNIDDGSADACGISSRSATPTAFTCANLPAAGHALRLDGVDELVTSSTAIEPVASNFTIEAWVRTTGSATQYVFGKRDAYGIGLGPAGGVVAFIVAGGGAPVSVPQTGSGYNDGQWHHVVGVFARGGNFTPYVDGVALATTSIAAAVGNVTSAYPALIGHYDPAQSGFFVGDVDEVRLWTTARTAIEIRRDRGNKLIGTETNLLAYFDMEDGSGTIVNDRTANNYDGTFTNLDASFDWLTPGSPADRPLGGALTFDGANEYAYCATTLGVAPTTATFETWVYPTNLTGTKNIYAQVSDAAGYTRLRFVNNQLSLYVNPADQLFAYTFSTNRWYHIAVVFNRAGLTASLYVDGVLEETKVYGATPNAIANRPHYIGVWNTVVTYFAGRLDEFRLWTTTRTAAQIRDNMYSTMVGNETGLRLHYAFDEGNFTILGDRGVSGTGNRHAQMYNMETPSDWITGVARGGYTNVELAVQDAAGNVGRCRSEVVISNNTPSITNSGLLIEKWALGTVIDTELSTVDGCSSGSGLVYSVTTLPTQGTLRRSGVAIGLRGEFSEADLDGGLITYDHGGGSATSDSIGFSVRDEHGAEITGQSFAITINQVNSAPVVATTAASFYEDTIGNVISGATMLKTDDVDNLPAHLTYTLTSIPTRGVLRKSGVALGISGTFTQADLNAGLVTYDHNGFVFADDSFTYSVADLEPLTDSDTFAITVLANACKPSIRASKPGVGQIQITWTDPGGCTYEMRRHTAASTIRSQAVIANPGTSPWSETYPGSTLLFYYLTGKP